MSGQREDGRCGQNNRYRTTCQHPAKPRRTRPVFLDAICGRYTFVSRSLCDCGPALTAEVVLWLHDVPRGCTATGWRDRGDRETTSRAEGISVEDGVTLRALHVMTSNHWT